MKLTTHHLRTGAALLLAGILLAGCDQSSSDAKHIKVGVINGAEQDVAEVAKKVAKEKYGLDVELVGFSGSLLPNDATNHGELDANVFQHRPFLEQDNQAHGYKLVAVGNTFVFPMAGYSKKIKTVAQIKEGATVAIPNDPTNLGRALLLLQKEKLITLKEGKGLLPTALDITDNPRHLQIMELEGAQLPRVLDDPKVDVAIISTTYIQQTGLSPVHDSVFIEDKNSPYVNILVAREDNKNAENVKEFLQSYQSPEVAKAAEPFLTVARCLAGNSHSCRAGRFIFLARRRESIEIKITDDRISSVPSQSGNVNVIPSNSKESSALLNGSAQLKMLAFGPPINCAPFRYRLNVRDVPMTIK